MNKRQAIVAAFVLIVIGLSFLFIHGRTVEPSDLPKNVGRLSEKISAEPVVDPDKKTNTPPCGENVNPLCAPGSTVYLTQAQQEYKLGEWGHNTPDVKDAKKKERTPRSRSVLWTRGGTPCRTPTLKLLFFIAAHIRSVAKPTRTVFSPPNTCPEPMSTSTPRRTATTEPTAITGSTGRASPA